MGAADRKKNRPVDPLPERPRFGSGFRRLFQLHVDFNPLAGAHNTADVADQMAVGGIESGHRVSSGPARLDVFFQERLDVVHESSHVVAGIPARVQRLVALSDLAAV
jgi:hypothetical protein